MWLLSKRLILIVLLLKPECSADGNTSLHFCGFEQTCMRDRTNIELSCCVSCECEDICIEKGNCCKDKKGLIDSKDAIKQQCIPSLYSPEGAPVDLGDVQYYLARTRCPYMFQDLNIKDKCERTQPKSLQDITLVSSENGSIIYKNVFCGICHGEKRTIAWELQASFKAYQCSDIPYRYFVNATSITEYALAHCSFIFLRPSNILLQSVICFENNSVVNTCNQTGAWDVYDGTLESLCLNSPDSVYIKTVLSSYSNVFCFLCNNKRSVVPEICPNLSGRFPSQSLFKLINVNQWTEVGRMEENKCKTNQIYDTFFGICKTLFCPVFSLPVNGQCVPFLDSEQTYMMSVRLKPLETVNKSQSVTNELKNKLFLIKRKLGFGECKICAGDLALEKDNTNDDLLRVLVRYAFETTNKCTMETIWLKLITIETSPLHISLFLDNQMIQFGVFWNYRSNQLDTLHRYRSFGHCKLLPGLGSFCPKIQLNMSEYEAVLNNHPKLYSLQFVQSKEDINATYFVCINNYIFEQSATGCQKYASVSMTIIASVVVKSYMYT